MAVLFLKKFQNTFFLSHCPFIFGSSEGEEVSDDEIVIRTDDPIQDRLDELRKEHDIARELVWSKCNDKSPQDLLKLLRLRRTWEACVSDDGDVYYANAETGESAWYVICVCVCPSLSKHIVTSHSNSHNTGYHQIHNQRKRLCSSITTLVQK